MRPNITKIEAALLRIDSASFQRLCDEYLYCRYGADFRHIVQTGVQLGKDQTTKGTPDTYVVLPNGQYVLIEYTKQQTDLLKKLHEDIAKCQDTTKTGLNPKDIQRIILFHASKKIDTKKDKELRNSCSTPLEIIGLGELAISIHNDYIQLARNYLDIPYGTLQLQTPIEFVAEHSRKAIGRNNPLLNPFRHREDDLSTLLEKVDQKGITVLTGGQGVGKTRLALEVLQRFVQTRPQYEPICIANKYAPLLEDLNEFVRSGKNYIFLIDDANRQMPILLGTLTHLYARPDVEFKIILTVRDYAFEVVRKHLTDYSWCSYTIEKFTDEQIGQIVSDEPFNIKNLDFRHRIRDLANGNPRLAIMASKLALEKQDLLALYDATDLYVRYYDNLTDSENRSLLRDPTRLKVLGLLAVFRHIDLLDEPFVEKLLSAFDLTRDILVTELSSLEKDELADVYMGDLSLFRLSDQNLATYAVYEIFIEKKILSVKSLLTVFFEDYPYRIRDAFYGVINAFDQERIISDIKLVTKKYYESIRGEDTKAFDFLEIFYFALPTQTLDYLFLVNSSLPTLIEHWQEKFFYFKISDDRGPLKSRLQLLFNFFAGFNEHFDTALELLIEFANNPLPLIPLLVQLIESRLVFSPEDNRYLTLRQTLVLEYLMNETKSGNEVARNLLFGVFPFFLRGEFQSTSAMRGRTVTIITFLYPITDPYSKLRTVLWEFLENHFKEFSEQSRSTLFSYNSSFSTRDNFVIVDFDKSRIISIIERHLVPDNFDDCHFVNEYTLFLNRCGLRTDETDLLAARFRSPEYKLYLQLDWNRFRDHDTAEELDDSDQYKQRKRHELQNALNLKSISEIEQLFDSILRLATRPEVEYFSLDEPLDTILSLLKKQDTDIFELAVIAFSSKDWPASISTSRVIRVVFDNEISKPDKWYGVFAGAAFHQAEWQFSFFSMITPSAITSEWSDKLVHFCHKLPIDNIYLSDRWWQNYLAVRPTIYQEMLALLSEKYEQTGTRYSLWEGFLEQQINITDEPDMTLFKKIYLQQLLICSSLSRPFDYSRSTLKVILAHDPDFLIDFLEAHYEASTDRFGHPDIKNIGFIWSLPDAVKLVLKVVHFMKSKKRFALHGSNFESLFQNVEKQYETLIQTFIEEYVKCYADDTHEIHNMVQAILHLNRYEEWLLIVRSFLINNQSIEGFMEISWSPNSFIGNGKTNFDQIRANRLSQVLEQVRQMPKKLPYLEHVKHLERSINSYEKSAEIERRRQFGKDDWLD